VRHERITKETRFVVLKTIDIQRGIAAQREDEILKRTALSVALGVALAARLRGPQALPKLAARTHP